jgi:L-threonylcarbamoyladenylate synthase
MRLWETQGYDIFSGALDGWCYLGQRHPPDGAVKAIIFGSPEEYARGLFSALRELETCGAGLIIADLPDSSGIGEAIRNRLRRAAGAA